MRIDLRSTFYRCKLARGGGIENNLRLSRVRSKRLRGHAIKCEDTLPCNELMGWGLIIDDPMTVSPLLTFLMMFQPVSALF